MTVTTLEEAEAVLARERERDEALEIKSQAERAANEEKRRLGIAKQRDERRAESQAISAACTTALESFGAVSYDALARCGATGVLAMLQRIMLTAERNIAVMDDDQERVKELQRQRAALPPAPIVPDLGRHMA